jgi:hypothetical protein
MKGHIKMSIKELDRVPVIEKVIKGLLTNQQGAEQVRVSKRHFRRLKKSYKRYGVAGLTHKARGQKSNREIKQEKKDRVIAMVKVKYSDFGPTLAHEKLAENGEISFSVETLRTEMIKVGLWKSSKRRKAHIHQLRERREQEGELVQVDGSPHAWFEDRADKCDLLVYIDDATGKLLWLEFTESETTEAYFKATKKYLLTHGKPVSFYVDKHTVFRVNTTKVDSAAVEDDNGLTQFGRAMKELNIELIHANTAQAKGRVERVNQTLQDRLVKELRLRGISSIEEGNKYLPKYMKKFNKRFSVEPKSKVNAHRPILKEDNLGNILCLKNIRVISKNLEIRYKNKTYQIKVMPRYEYTLRRARVEVIEKINSEILIKYRTRELEYTTIETQPKSKILDSKSVNKCVKEIKRRQGKTFQFNLLGGTFLFWRKPDISTLD